MILRCSGTHACRDEDHATGDELVREASQALRDGRGVLIDVRKFHVVYGSGIADLYNPLLPGAAGWNPTNGARIAFLYMPVGKSDQKGYRWTITARAMELARGAAGEGLRCVDFFTDECEALSFITSGETSGRGPTPLPRAGG